jgi:hypothetical protein
MRKETNMHVCNNFNIFTISNKQDSNAHAPYVQRNSYHRFHLFHIRFKQNHELGLPGDDLFTALKRN